MANRHLAKAAFLRYDELDTIEIIKRTDELPALNGSGRHELADSTVYIFNGFITSANGLELGTDTILLGFHGGHDGFIHTGTGTALYGDGSSFLMRNLYMHAPGGTLFDLTGTTSEEMLVESCSFSDAAGLGNMASLGTIDGLRVPTFKGTNFEEFDAGLTLTGTSQKVFFEGCPLRTISGSGVTILSFDATFETDIVDIVNCYVKGVQSDTVIVDVDGSATINDVFQYRGTTHDSTATASNILTGGASPTAVGYRVVDSYPLSDSAVVGELSLDSQATQTISSQDTYQAVTGTTSLGNETERVSQQSAGILQYDGKKDVKVHVTAHLTVVAPNNDTFAVVIAKNGTPEPTSETQLDGSSNVTIAVSLSGVEDLQNGDTMSIQIKNIDSTGNIDVVKYNLNYFG